MEAKARTAIKRPTGASTDRYRGIEKWSYRRWAWEFLRRNPEFIAECKRVKNCSANEKTDVADRFGLKTLKMYSEAYKGRTGYPKFTMGAISSWTNLDPEKLDARNVQVNLSHGHVLIRFNLESVIHDRKALDKQIMLAERRIIMRLGAFEKILKKDAAVHKHKAMNFGMYIRLLDLMAAGKTPLECAKTIYPSKVANARTDNYLRQDVKKPIEAAQNMAKEGYRYLSVLTGKPKGKGIQVEL